jgi:hypothetical protein
LVKFFTKVHKNFQLHTTNKKWLRKTNGMLLSGVTPNEGVADWGSSFPKEQVRCTENTLRTYGTLLIARYHLISTNISSLTGRPVGTECW